MKKFKILGLILALCFSCNFSFAKDYDSGKAVKHAREKLKLREAKKNAAQENAVQPVEIADEPVLIEEVSTPQETNPNITGGVIIDTINDETATSLFSEWWNGDYMTGNWFGVRDFLEDHGVVVGSSMLFSPWVKTRGGMDSKRKQKSYFLYNLDVTVDTEKLGLWKGGTFYALYQLKRGHGLTRDYIGDYQCIDGWDFQELNKLMEFWFEQALFEDKVVLKLGRIDASVDFGALESGFNFMDTSFSVIPTTPMPGYPDNNFGGSIFLKLSDKWTLKDGLYAKDRRPFNLTQLEYDSDIKNHRGKYMLGFWTHSNHDMLEDYNGSEVFVKRKNYGAYAAFEQMVYKKDKADPEDDKGLTLFGQLGFAPSKKNDLGQYYGVGINYKGLIPTRDDDILGIGVALADFSRRYPYRDYSATGTETVLETFYRFHINKWYYVQPTVNFIFNTCGQYPNTVALGIRSVITF